MQAPCSNLAFRDQQFARTLGGAYFGAEERSAVGYDDRRLQRMPARRKSGQPAPSGESTNALPHLQHRHSGL